MFNIHKSIILNLYAALGFVLLFAVRTSETLRTFINDKYGFSNYSHIVSVILLIFIITEIVCKKFNVQKAFSFNIPDGKLKFIYYPAFYFGLFMTTLIAGDFFLDIAYFAIPLFYLRKSITLNLYVIPSFIGSYHLWKLIIGAIRTPHPSGYGDIMGFIVLPAAMLISIILLFFLFIELFCKLCGAKKAFNLNMPLWYFPIFAIGIFGSLTPIIFMIVCFAVVYLLGFS